METTVVKGLFKEKVYNGDESIPGYMQDYYSNVFGGARLRQVRINAGMSFIDLSIIFRIQCEK